MDGPGLSAAIAGLLRKAGLSGTPVVRPVTGGGNNKAYAVAAGGRRYLAKVYYSHPNDSRDRLGAEYALLSYAHGAEIKAVPAPIACDRQSNIGIYEFIDGDKIASGDVTRQHVLEAARFAAQLNAGSRGEAGLAPASEACFSIGEHVAMVDRRLGWLQQVEASGETGARAQQLVREITATWEAQRARLGAADIAPLGEADRCISPSDFGFHNALLANNGELRFIDFEYAGWDDPAKMIGDFFCQPAVPVPLEYFDEFAAEALRNFAAATALRERARLLLPALQVKWCCIMLNEFLPDAARRRHFADSTQTPEQRQRAQLEKAERFFQSRLN